MTASDFFRVARRPRWIGVLVLALAIAAGFAALGQWQLARSIENAEVAQNEADSEVPVALASIASPQTPMNDTQVGRMVTVDGTSSPAISPCSPGVRTTACSEPGWSGMPSRTRARRSRSRWAGPRMRRPRRPRRTRSRSIRPGRWGDTCRASRPTTPTSRPASAALSRWRAHQPLGRSPRDHLRRLPGGERGRPPGLTTIDSPAPSREVGLNWLNIFYAAEWAIFAGFAIYLWYRLVGSVVSTRRRRTASRHGVRKLEPCPSDPGPPTSPASAPCSPSSASRRSSPVSSCSCSA